MANMQKMNLKEKENILFLLNKIQQLLEIIEELEMKYPEKSFKLDGILIGNIGEILASHYYGIKLYSQSNPTYDGETIDTKRKVQIKVTQNMNYIIIREKPEYLIVLYINGKCSKVSEIYNGSGELVFRYVNYVKSQNYYRISVAKLMELNNIVEAEDKIPAVVPIDKLESRKSEKVSSSKREAGDKPSLVEGYINKNNQQNMGYAGHRGNKPDQRAFKMKCLCCEYEYKSNGCDVWLHKCPRCQGGKELANFNGN